MINRSLDLTSIIRAFLDELLTRLEVEAGALRLMPALDSVSPVSLYKGFSNEAVALLEESRMGLEESSKISAPGDGRTDSLIQALRKHDFQFLGIYPIHSGNRRVGNLLLASTEPKTLSETEDDLLGSLSELLGVAIASTQMREQSNKLSEDLIALQEVNKIVSHSLNLEDIVQRIVAEGKRLVETNECHIFLVDERRMLLVGAATTQTESLDIRSIEMPFKERSNAVDAFTEKRVVVVEKIREGGGHPPHLAEVLNWKSAIFAPLLTKDQAIGVLICSDSLRERSFTQEEVFRSETLAHQAAFALERARLFQAVSRSQREWETTFDAMQDCVSVHDTKGQVIRANMSLSRRLRTTPAKVIGKFCSEIYNAGGNTLIPCRHLRPLHSESVTVEELELSLLEGTFQISVSPWYDKNNNLAGSIHVAKDISNEKLLQQQLIQSEKISAIGELISGIAHELNNPLTGVMGYSQLLQLRKDLDDRAKDSLHKINNLALRCQKIVQNLLSFARKQKPERTPTDINEIIEKTVELRHYEMSVNNIRIEQDLDPDLPRTIADSHQLQQVFLNIITNAEQAMLDSNGRGMLAIRTRVNPAKSRIVVEFADDGPGIPEAYLTKIFDPFFTTKEVGKGTGLGLSLSYGIIKEHGGNIYARSHVGEGCTFLIELPIIEKIPEAFRPAPELLPQALQFENLIRNRRILVVDDERYILDFFVEVFQVYPMSVDTADNGMMALEKIKMTDYDVIISDFRMPTMSGKQLYEWIKENRPSLASRIIFVTGDTVSPETRTFFEDNSNRFLAKPFKIEEVKEAIQQTLSDS